MSGRLRFLARRPSPSRWWHFKRAFRPHRRPINVRGTAADISTPRPAQASGSVHRWFCFDR